MTSNIEIKKKIKEAGIFQWQVADELGISELTFGKKLRKPVDDSFASRIFVAIEKLHTEKVEANKA